MDEPLSELDENLIAGGYELMEYTQNLEHNARGVSGCRPKWHHMTMEAVEAMPIHVHHPLPDQAPELLLGGGPHRPRRKQPDHREPEPPHKRPEHGPPHRRPDHAEPERPHPRPGPPGPHHPPPHAPELIKNLTFTLPTLLTNHSVTLRVTQFKILPHLYTTKLFASGVPIDSPDIVSRNGAVHVVKHLLNPFRNATHVPHRPGGDECGGCFGPDEWQDWEKWLPAWGAQD